MGGARRAREARNLLVAEGDASALRVCHILASSDMTSPWRTSLPPLELLTPLEPLEPLPLEPRPPGVSASRAVAKCFLM